MPERIPSQAAARQANDRIGLGRWQQVVTVDQLTGKKEISYKNRALHPFSQFGRPVETELFIFCQGRSQDALLSFSECPFRNFLNRLNQLGFKGGGLIRGGVADVDA
jgi:hypothetical protein